MPSFVRSKKAHFEGPWDPEFTFGSNVYSINNSRFCLTDPNRDDEMGKLIHDRLMELIVVSQPLRHCPPKPLP